MTPVTGAHLSLPAVQAPSAVQTALVAFSSPLAQLSQTVIMSSAYLFNSDLDPSEAASWFYANFGNEFAPTIPGIVPLVLTSPVLPNPTPPPATVFNPFGTYSSVGLLPQIIDDALPIISQLGYNGSDYLNVTATSVGLAGVQLGNAIVDSIAALVSFDIPGSIEALLTGISQVGSTLLTAGGYVLTGVVERLTAVVEATIGLLPTVLGATLRQIQVVGDSVGTVFNNFFDAFGTAAPIENAWNALVDGLLGPSGIPGTLVNLTIGAGVQTGPITDLTEEAIGAAFVPSIRTEIQTGVNVIQNALSTPVVPPTASVAAAAAVAEVEAPAAVTEVEVPAVAEVTEVEAPAAAEAPAAPRGARAAAVVDAPAAVEAPAAAEAPAAVAGDDDGAAKKTPKRGARGAKKAS
jgi:hypothetical protein